MDLKQAAKEYIPQTTKNVSELEKVSTGLDVKQKEVLRDDGTSFKYNYVMVGDEEYRIPASVLKQLKAQLEDKPNMRHFRVKKSGEGLKTEYTVIVVD